jgi:hypothetical protein
VLRRNGAGGSGGIVAGGFRCGGGVRILPEGEPEARTFGGEEGAGRLAERVGRFAVGGSRLGGSASTFGGGGKRLSGPPSSKA